MMLIRTRFAPNATADADTITGRVVTYGQEFERFGVPLVYRAGSIALPVEGIGTVKLCVEHDTERPIGYGVAAEETDDGLRMTFALPDLAHTEKYRDEIVATIRDGFSVGVYPDEQTRAAIDAAMWSDEPHTEPIVVTGHLSEVSVVTAPQFNSSRVEHASEGSTMDLEPVLVTTSAPPPVPGPPSHVGVTPARTRPVSSAHHLADLLHTAQTSQGASGVAQTLTAALADIVPNGTGNNPLAGLAIQAAGELCTDNYDPIYDVAVTNMQLNGIKVHGWRWKVPPTVAAYAGLKAEIPTGAASLEYAEALASRWAGGHDLDRVYVDLGGGDVLTSYWREMAKSGLVFLDAKRLEAIQASAGTATAATSVTDAILQGLAAVPDATYVLIGADLWAAGGAQPESELPALLTGAGIYGNLMPSTIVRAVGLTGKVIVGKKSGINFYTADPAIRLEAVNIPHAGIDAGMYGYYTWLTACPNAVKAYTVAAVAADVPSKQGR